MKNVILLFVTFLGLSIFSHADDKITRLDPYKTIPHFGIPAGFYTDHELRPQAYLERYEVPDTNAKLSHAEKLSAALLVIAADHANFEKYHQSYGVRMDSPLLVLLQRNFPGLSKLKPSHDVNPGEPPIRDLGAFFRAWLQEALSEELQEERVRKTLGINDEASPG